MSPPEHFPCTWTPESDLPGYLTVRAEGLPLREAFWSGLGYLRKYRHGKWTAPPEEVLYFDQQRRLLRHLAADDREGVRLALAGDLMWIRDSWGDFLSPEVLAYLNGHDAVLANLETPIAPRLPVPGFLPDYFTYNSDPRLVTSFRRPDGRSTFSALATANNHSLDRGDEGLAETLAFLDEQNIPHAGVRRLASDLSWVNFVAGGFHIGFYAACWGLNNPALVQTSAFHLEILDGLVPRVRLPVNLSRIRAALEGMAAAGMDLRIVALHWGHEFEFYPLPELMQVGREIVRAGADIVLGTHPHVVQPLEVCLVNGYEDRYRRTWPSLPALEEPTGCLLDDGTGVPRKGLIAYSLGNLATAMYTLHCRTGLILGLRLLRDEQTGRVDWIRPEMQLVFNVRRDAAGRRRLMLLESYLRERERRGDPATRLRELAAYLDRHLLGPAEKPGQQV